MKSHAQNYTLLSQSIIKDAQKLGFADDPNFKKALQATKAVATRMNNLVAAYEKQPESSPVADDATQASAAAVPEVTAVNQNNLATRDADNYGPDQKLNQKGLALAKAQAAFLKKRGKNVPSLLTKAIAAADGRAQDDIPTQVVPKSDLDREVAARQAAGSPPIREIRKRFIREELERIYG